MFFFLSRYKCCSEIASSDMSVEPIHNYFSKYWASFCVSTMFNNTSSTPEVLSIISDGMRVDFTETTQDLWVI